MAETKNDLGHRLGRERAPGCPPRIELEEALGASVLAGRDPEAPAHVASCPHCAALWNTLCAEREKYLALRPVSQFKHQLELRSAEKARPRMVWGWAAMASGALALGLVALVVWPGGTPPLDTTAPGPSDARFKGDLAIRFEVQRGDRAWDAQPGEPLRAGDVLSFGYASQQALHAAVIGLEEEGDVSLIFPSAPTLPNQLAASSAGRVPRTAVLDAHRGPEAFLVFARVEPFSVAELLNGLSGGYERFRGKGGELPAFRPEGLAAPLQARVWIRKP